MPRLKTKLEYRFLKALYYYQNWLRTDWLTDDHLSVAILETATRLRTDLYILAPQSQADRLMVIAWTDDELETIFNSERPINLAKALLKKREEDNA